MRHITFSIILMLTAVISSAQSFDGIDVSHHQGKINWSKVQKSCPNLKFVYVKATEGKTYVDPRYEENVKGASKVGFKVGVYHFFRMTSGAREQFANFNAAIAKVGIDLIPMVDIETSDKQSVREVKDSLMVFVNRKPPVKCILQSL